MVEILSPRNHKQLIINGAGRKKQKVILILHYTSHCCYLYREHPALLSALYPQNSETVTFGYFSLLFFNKCERLKKYHYFNIHTGNKLSPAMQHALVQKMSLSCKEAQSTQCGWNCQAQSKVSYLSASKLLKYQNTCLYAHISSKYCLRNVFSSLY